MKFYSDIPATLGVWDGEKMLTFEGGIYETDDPREIALLKNAGYRHDEVTPPAPDTPLEEEQKPLDAMTFHELRAEAKAAGVQGYGKMSKAALVEALKG
jgi:hypothetical protein